MTLQEAKNEIAKRKGYSNWQAFLSYEITNHSTTAFWGFIEEAAELYGKSKWDESAKKVLLATHGYIDEGDIPVFNP